MNILGRLLPGMKRRTVEDMLADLGTVGIRLRPGIPVRALFAETSQEEVARQGHERLLIEMGGQLHDDEWDEGWHATWNPEWNEKRPSSDVWTFLHEAIEGPGSYAWIINHLSGLTGGEIVFDAIRDHVDVEARVAWAEVDRGGDTQHLTFEVYNDWADARVLEWFQRTLTDAGSRRRFARHDLGQDELVICKTPEDIAAVNRVTGLQFTVV